jgi:signal transduction histidine kinase
MYFSIQHIRQLFLAIFLISGVLFLSAAYAGHNRSSRDQVIDLSYLVDDVGNLSFQDVKGKTFKKYDAFLNRGYTDSITWVKVIIRKSDITEPIILRTRPYFLDHIDLYSDEDIVPNLKRSTGDAVKFADLPYQGKSHGFRIYPKNNPSVYYLRVQTTSSTLLAVDALTQESLRNTEELENLFLGIYLGFMLWIFTWALLNFNKVKDPILGSFAIYQFVNVLMALSYTGYLGRFILHDFISRDFVTSNLVLLASVAGFIFHKNFLGEFNLNRYIKAALYLIFVFTIFNLLLGNFYKFSLALELNAYLILVSVFIFSVILINIYFKNRAQTILVILVYVLLNFVVLFTLLPLLGVIKSTELALHTSLTHGLFTGLLVFVLMHDRSKKMLAKMQLSETEALLTKQKLLGEQKIRETQDAFIGMLSHELKSPLGVIRLGLNNLKRKLDGSLRDDISLNLSRLNLAIDDMDSVIERCVEANRVEHGQIVVNKNRVSVSALINALIDYSEDRKERIVFLGKENTYFETDEQFLKIIISNFIDNAIKYSVKDSKIQASCYSSDSYLEVTFENSIESSRVIDSSQVFSKYYRDSESKRQRGSGLGLWLSRELAKLLGGDLVYSHAGNSVKFQLKISK